MTFVTKTPIAPIDLCLVSWSRFSLFIVLCVLEMASQTQGIQQLLAAEKRAAEKVAEARKRKAKRLKQAKEEAQDEVEKYRQEREKQFKEFEAKHMGTREGVAAKIEAETKVKIQEMNSMVVTQQEAVIKDVLSLVYDIKPELHVNYRLK